MELTLTLDDRLAADLRALAEARGLSVDELGRAALLAGLDQLNSPLSQLGIRMRSPIIALGPIPPMHLTPFDSLSVDQHTDAD